MQKGNDNAHKFHFANKQAMEEDVSNNKKIQITSKSNIGSDKKNNP